MFCSHAFCVFIESNWYWQSTQIIIRAHSIWTCKTSSGLINIFKDSLYTSVTCFQLCMSCMCLESSLDRASITSIFALLLNHCRLVLCVRVNVEMTSVVELFSDRFSFSVKSGMWTDHVLPSRPSCMCRMCCMCSAYVSVSFTLKSQIKNLLMKSLSSPFTKSAAT